MGGFTVIHLRDKAQENIDMHNNLLRIAGAANKYRFYSLIDCMYEYEWFVDGRGTFPEKEFPRHLIHDFSDFLEYWNHKKHWLVPEIGTLEFDCYFGRTGQQSLRAIGRYAAFNWKDIEKIKGSYLTFIEKAMTSKERQLILKHDVKLVGS